MTCLVGIQDFDTLDLKGTGWADDYAKSVNPGPGDKYRDLSTKGVLYLAASKQLAENDVIMVALDRPNHNAINDFGQAAMSAAGAAAVHFPIATSGYVSSIVNSSRGVRGGSITLSGSDDGLWSALKLSRLVFSFKPGAQAHLFWMLAGSEPGRYLAYVRVSAAEANVEIADADEPEPSRGAPHRGSELAFFRAIDGLPAGRRLRTALDPDTSDLTWTVQDDD